ncbi:MAG: hypothetical protein IJX49_02250 [Clostridia bacterium]|nr:hypothetical protein [Clostridia bacterium]
MKVKKISRVVSLVLLAAIGFFAFAFGSIRASADTSAPDKIISDFTDSSTEGWTLNEKAAASSEGIQVIGGGSLTSESSVRSFLMQITFGVMNKGFEITFGEGQNACSIRFDGAYLRLNGLVTEAGGDVYVMNDVLTSNSIVQIEVIGGEVTLSVKPDGEPYDVLGTPVATFSYGEGKAISDGKIKLSAYEGGMFGVQKISVYSLDASVEIETEDYVAPPTSEEEEEEKKGCGSGCSSVIGGSVLCAAFTLTGIVLWARRKEQ